MSQDSPLNSRRSSYAAQGSRLEAFGWVEWALLCGVALIWGSSFLGIADRLMTVLVVCIQALWGGLAFTVVIVAALADGVGSSVPLFGTLLWALGAAFIALTPRVLRTGAARRRNRAGSA